MFRLQKDCLRKALRARRPPACRDRRSVEGEAANRAIRIAEVLKVPLVRRSQLMQTVTGSHNTRARNEGQRVYGEVLAGHLLVDDSVYRDPDFETAAAHVMSPPFRSKEHQDALVARPAVRQFANHGDRPLLLLRRSEGDGQRRFPHDTRTALAGVENRLEVLWDHGVRTGRLTMNEFVAVTSTNTAQIFNIYPRKGVVAVGADADIVVWDPAATKTISAKTHKQNVDYNIFEGMTVTGCASHTDCQRQSRVLRRRRA